MARQIDWRWDCFGLAGTRHLTAPQVQFLRDGGTYRRFVRISFLSQSRKKGAGPKFCKKGLDIASSLEAYSLRFTILIV